MKYSEFFREMVRIYQSYRGDEEFRWLQRYGKLKSWKSWERFDSEEKLFEYLYLDR
ncbi:hypothetical protein BH24ACT21_BH24ACT21_17160 [soil metagenome]